MAKVNEAKSDTPIRVRTESHKEFLQATNPTAEIVWDTTIEPPADLDPVFDNALELLAEKVGAHPLPTCQHGARTLREGTGVISLTNSISKTFTGGGMSEAYAPGEAGTRFFAELGGGMATSPYRLLVNQTGAAKGFLTNFAQAFSPDSREAKAANILYSGLVESGEDPKKIIDFLNSPRALEAIRTANPTVGQLTGVPLFTRLEATLAKSHPNYRAEIDKQGEDALSAYKLLIGRLREIGNPQAMTVAADLERRHFMDMVNSRMDLAAKNAADKIDRIKVDSPSTRRQVGQVVKDETLAALDEARELERDLWKKAVAEGFRRTRAGEIVPKAATPSNTMKEFLYVLDGMTPERYSKEYMGTLGSIMTRLGYKDDFYNRFVQGKRTEQFLQTERVPEEYLKNVRGKATNIEDLVQIRSDLLSYARKAARNNDSDEARIYGRLAEAVLDDISKEGHAAYNTARQFSKDLNEYFTRGYANELRATGISGRDRLPAEVLVSKVYGSNADLTALRINEIEDAASFARNQYNKIQADPDIPTARKNQQIQDILHNLFYDVLNVEFNLWPWVRNMAMELVKKTKGAQMMFPSGKSFAELVCEEIEKFRGGRHSNFTDNLEAKSEDLREQ